MYNIIFCLDEKYVNLIKNVFKTFIKFHDPKKFYFYFVLYDDNNKIHKDIITIIQNISSDFNIFYKYFTPTNEFKVLIEKYEDILFDDNIEKKNISCFGKLSNWSRFFISHLFPNLTTGLYLDVDILFNNNIEDIFNIDISNHIIGIIPYNNYSTKNEKNSKLIISYINKHLDKIRETDLLSKLNINLDNLKTNIYNCGVMYFNFNLFNENKILDKVITLLDFNVNNHRIIYGGTEKVQNVIIHNYKSLPGIYNVLTNKKYCEINLKKDVILHFKGTKNILNDKKYINTFNQIMS